VSTGRSQLERATRAFLSTHLGEIGRCPCASAVRRKRWLGLELVLAAEVRDSLGEVPDRNGGDTGEGCFPRGVGRAEEAFGAEPSRALGDGKNAADPTQAPVERELADCGRPFERVTGQLVGRRKQGQRDGQIEAGTLLAQLRRGEVDRDAPFRELQLGGGDSTPDPLARLLTRTVGEADDREAGDAIANVRLYVDPAGFDADERMRDRACKHTATLRVKS
jgi:hypothetical protein